MTRLQSHIKAANSSFLCNSLVYKPVCIIMMKSWVSLSRVCLPLSQTTDTKLNFAVSASTGDNIGNPFCVGKYQQATKGCYCMNVSIKCYKFIINDSCPFLSLLLYCDSQEHWLWNVQDLPTKDSISTSCHWNSYIFWPSNKCYHTSGWEYQLWLVRY